MTLFLSNPFAAQDPVPFDGQGMNPLLRHPGMIFHPPALYLGYVGLAVPFAFALAAVIVGKVDDWPAIVRRWTLGAWLFLGLGLLLGARWAYDVLGWGGYWGWDPVENAGLMPWITATALLHGAVIQEQRGKFKWWNFVMAVMSFVLVLFGTFTTRSGLIQSVHAFGRSPLGPHFLAAIGVSLAGSLVLAVARRSQLSSSEPVGGFLSREGMFLLTLILFSTLTVSVMIGSVLPTLTEAFTSQRFEAGPAWFDRVTGPQFAAMVLILGLCPVLGRAASVLNRLRARGLPILVGAVIVPGAAVLAGFAGWSTLVGFGLVGMAGGTALAEYARDVAARNRKDGEGALRALLTLFVRNRRRYGGYLVHIGIILMALGIIGTRLHVVEAEEVMAFGRPVELEDYTLVYEDLERSATDEYVRTTATVSVYQEGTYLISLRPWTDSYASFEQTVATPALRSGLREDLYLVLAGWSGDGASITLKAFVNPLASFLWLGGLVFMAGGAVALWPDAPARRMSALEARRRALWAALGTVLGLATLIATGLSMWGPNPGAVVLPAARPLVGQEAPEFRLELLDGTPVSLSDLRGQAAVVNFWASWCLSCEDELPALQSAWEEYEDQGVVLVGILYQDDIAAAQGMITEFGLTYPIGLDQDDRIATAYGITGIPETFVIDLQGVVSEVFIGPVTGPELQMAIDDALGR
jgi:cytochrome c-type biogenesis protein CcmF